MLRIILIGLTVLITGYLLINHSETVVSPKFEVTEQDKIYINQSLGLEFKYPKDFLVKEDSETEFNKRGNGDFRKNFKGYVGYEPGKFMAAVVVLDQTNSYEQNPLTIWIFDNPDNLSIDSWYKNFWYYPFVWGDFTYTGKFEQAPKEEASISGQLAKLGVVDYQPGKPKFVYIKTNNKMYLFRIIGQAGEKILSSIRLIE